jgi:hypothetical protein
MPLIVPEGPLERVRENIEDKTSLTKVSVAIAMNSAHGKAAPPGSDSS